MILNANIKQFSGPGKLATFEKRALGPRCIKPIKTTGIPVTIIGRVEQNIVICQWQADQLLAETEGYANN